MDVEMYICGNVYFWKGCSVFCEPNGQNLTTVLVPLNHNWFCLFCVYLFPLVICSSFRLHILFTLLEWFSSPRLEKKNWLAQCHRIIWLLLTTESPPASSCLFRQHAIYLQGYYITNISVKGEGKGSTLFGLQHWIPALYLD